MHIGFEKDVAEYNIELNISVNLYDFGIGAQRAEYIWGIIIFKIIRDKGILKIINVFSLIDIKFIIIIFLNIYI